MKLNKKQQDVLHGYTIFNRNSDILKALFYDFKYIENPSSIGQHELHDSYHIICQIVNIQTNLKAPRNSCSYLRHCALAADFTLVNAFFPFASEFNVDAHLYNASVNRPSMFI